MFGKRQRHSPPDFEARHAALDARPCAAPPVRTEERDGKLYVTIRFRRPAWQRVLGAEAECERTFGLDAYGQEVYRGCDGRRNVREIVRRFAQKNHIAPPEAEMNVTRFLRTLIAKGLIVMEMEKPR